MSKKNKERKLTTSCGGVVWRVRDEKVEILLIKQFSHKDRWGIPKGHVDAGETLEECAVREIWEETGVKSRLGTRLQDCYVQNNAEDKTVVSWLAEPVGSHVPNHNDPDSEVADARWFDVAELPEIMVYQRSLIASAVNAVFKHIAEVKAEDPLTPSERASVYSAFKGVCLAARRGSGGGTHCELSVHHTGDHSDGEYRWSAR